MRVTDSMLYSQSIANIDQAQSAVQTATNQSSTGIAVNTPWDNPGAAGLAVTYEINSAKLTALGNETTAAANELSSADVALNSVATSIQSAVSLAEETGSDVMSATQRAAQVTTVQGLQASIVSALNTQVGNRYIFGGSVDNTPPFDAAGDYSGDGEVRQVEIAPGVMQDASVNVQSAIKGTNGGVDVFAALNALSTALSSNDGAGIIASETDLNTALNQVFEARSAEGSNAAALQAAASVNQTAQTQQTAILSTTVDADEVTAATNLSQAQTVLQAAIDASSKTFQLELTDLQQQGA